MEKHYNSPPVVEALCEFQLEKEDTTLAGVFFGEVETDFPIKEQRSTRKVDINANDQGIVEHQVQTIDYAVFRSSGKNHLIQVSPSSVSVNFLQPYGGWDIFRDDINRALEVLLHAQGSIRLKRIGMRYINRIEIPRRAFDLEEYFVYRPSMNPDNIVLSSFMLGSVLHYEDERDVCNLQLVSIPADNEHNSCFLLDIDYSTKDYPIEKATEWVEVAHSHIIDLFEKCITDQLRDLFEVVKDVSPKYN